MAEAVMGPLVGRLQELAMSEARAMVAVNDDVRSLRDKLMWMQAFLRDAEPRRRVKNDELIRVCLQQTRDAVFDAEDAVDQYFFQVDLSRYIYMTTHQSSMYLSHLILFLKRQKSFAMSLFFLLKNTKNIVGVSLREDHQHTIRLNPKKLS
jgi:hypothetical protein